MARLCVAGLLVTLGIAASAPVLPRALAAS